MKTLSTSLLALIFLIAGCKQTGQKTTGETKEEPTGVAALNALSDKQVEEGWMLLFDGQTESGWRTFKNQENDSWEVSHGTLHCKPFEQAEKRADLVTVDQYDNFELAFEWRISPQGNSGVMFRVTEDYDQPFFTGPEYQLLDDGGYPGEVKDVNFSGGNYDMHAPINKTLMPLGEWNTSRIVATGNHVEHWLNGTKVVEYEIGSDDWNKRKANSKWNDVEGYGVPKKGYIDLQDHSHEAWFRNIMIRTL